jgi:hypothetical protein
MLKLPPNRIDSLDAAIPSRLRVGQGWPGAGEAGHSAHPSYPRTSPSSLDDCASGRGG